MTEPNQNVWGVPTPTDDDLWEDEEASETETENTPDPETVGTSSYRAPVPTELTSVRDFAAVPESQMSDPDRLHRVESEAPVEVMTPQGFEELKQDAEAVAEPPRRARRGGRTKSERTTNREQRVLLHLISAGQPQSKMQIVQALPDDINPQMIYLALRQLKEDGKVMNYRNDQSAWVWSVV